MATRSSPSFALFSSLRFDSLLLESSANSEISVSPSPFYMLSYHRDRILEAATHFGFSTAAEHITGPQGLQHILQVLEASVKLESSVPLRVRIVLCHDGSITVETNETPAVPLGNLFPARIPPPATVSALEASTLVGATMAHDGDALQAMQSDDPSRICQWHIMVDPKKTTPSPFTMYKTTIRDVYTEARKRTGIKSMMEPKEVLIISDTQSQIIEGSLTSVYFWRGGRWVTPPISSGGQAGTTRRWLLGKGLCSEEVVSSESLVDGEECWISNGVRGLIWGKIKL